MERRRRIKITVAAFAYEILNQPIMTDEEYDTLAKRIDLAIDTGRLDDWFRQNFEPYTGQWIYRHPELDKVRGVYERMNDVGQ